MSDTSTLPLVVRRPFNSMKMRDLPGFPAAVADRLKDLFGIETLFQFREQIPGNAETGCGSIREAMVLLGVIEAQQQDQATWSVIRHLTGQDEEQKEEKPKRAKKAKVTDPENSPARARSADANWMQQYEAAKAQHPGMIVLFRSGDHYEVHENDVEIVAKVCPAAAFISHSKSLAAIPVNRLESCLGLLLKAGHRTAICEPKENAASEGEHRPDPTSAAAVAPKRRRSQAVSAPAATPLSDAASFDESTPPPRRRPGDDPLPKAITLPGTLPILEQWAEWQQQGRLPVGSSLLLHVGSWDAVAGYIVEAGEWPAGYQPTAIEIGSVQTLSTVTVLSPQRRMYMIVK